MMDTTEVYACYTVKIYKYKSPKKFKQGGARARRAGAGSVEFFYFLFPLTMIKLDKSLFCVRI